MRDGAIPPTSRKFVPILSRIWRFPRQPPVNGPVGGSSAWCTRHHQCARGRDHPADREAPLAIAQHVPHPGPDRQERRVPAAPAVAVAVLPAPHSLAARAPATSCSATSARAQARSSRRAKTATRTDRWRVPNVLTRLVLSLVQLFMNRSLDRRPHRLSRRAALRTPRSPTAPGREACPGRGAQPGGSSSSCRMPDRQSIASEKSSSQIDSMQQRSFSSLTFVFGSSGTLRLSQTSLIRTGGIA